MTLLLAFSRRRILVARSDIKSLLPPRRQPCSRFSPTLSNCQPGLPKTWRLIRARVASSAQPIPNGLWIEGTYLEVIPSRRVAFTWGGIEGLKIGESTVQFTLDHTDIGTSVLVRHFGLSYLCGPCP